MYVVYNLVIVYYMLLSCFFFFKQKTAYEMRISDWSSDVCSSDLLALRTILAGIKTAAVINVGTATLGALIGAGGYGQPILAGIRLDDIGLILEGAVPAALLALLVQGIFRSEERRVGKACGRTCRSRWWPSHLKKKKTNKPQ